MTVEQKKVVRARALKTGMSQSCGCLQKERVSEALTDDLIGQKFGRLTVVSRNGSWHPKNYDDYKVKGGVRAVWHCVCDCGGEYDAVGELLKNGDITSCGCSRTSKYELYVKQYLERCGYAYDVDYFQEYTFSGLRGIGGGLLRFDFLVKMHSGETVLIECQGEQHIHSVAWFGGDKYLNRLNQHDDMKRNYAVEHNVRLIEVPYTMTTYLAISDFLQNNDVF